MTAISERWDAAHVRAAQVLPVVFEDWVVRKGIPHDNVQSGCHRHWRGPDQFLSSFLSDGLLRLEADWNLNLKR
jgi:hypothetical protein